jgi:hypothetical protein
VICTRCGHDSKAKDRTGGICPSCHQRFAFEPGGLFTDRAFARAIDTVSSSGHLRWGVEHLYYELCRREEKRNTLLRVLRWVAKPLPLTAIALVFAAAFVLSDCSPVLGIAVLFFGFLAGRAWVRRGSPRQRFAPITQETFSQLWQRWQAVHGSPQGLIVRRQSPPGHERPRESDIGDYSFDRAVICDRSRTVDLLLANNFHFENNCAVLSVSGYPAGPFETVRAMLKRNPRLEVFALHDATPDGCRMAHHLAHDPAWFQGHVPVTDVGLRPRHSPPFQGLLLRAESGPVAAGSGITEEEAAWLSECALELAAIRPEQVLKRLYRALNWKPADSYSASPDDMEVILDIVSFSADAGDSDGGADSFG